LFSIDAFKSYISQGSATTYLRFGGIFSDSIITNVLLIRQRNKFENRSIFDEVKAHTTKCASFLSHTVLFPIMFIFDASTQNVLDC